MSTWQHNRLRWSMSIGTESLQQTWCHKRWAVTGCETQRSESRPPESFCIQACSRINRGWRDCSTKDLWLSCQAVPSDGSCNSLLKPMGLTGGYIESKHRWLMHFHRSLHHQKQHTPSLACAEHTQKRERQRERERERERERTRVRLRELGKGKYKRVSESKWKNERDKRCRQK